MDLYSNLSNGLHPTKGTLHVTCNFPAQALSTVSFLYEGEPPPPISTTWGAYRAIRLTLGAVNLFGMHIFCQSPSLVAGTSLHLPKKGWKAESTCGVQQSWVKSCITLWSNAGRMVTHPCINRAHDCLTSVIKRKTFAPCYVSPHVIKKS